MHHPTIDHLLSLILILCLTTSLQAQNILRNGNHEDFQPAPSVPNPANLCFRELYPFGYIPPPLNPQNPPGIASANGSPDHRCENPHQGEAHGGFFLSPKMENPIYAFCDRLVPGETYECSFFWRLSSGSDRAGKSIFLWLTDTTFQGNNSPIQTNGTDLFEVRKSDPSASLLDTTYQQAQFTFVAQSSANGLILGNMLTAAQPAGSEVVIVNQQGSGFAYYLVDDLSIRPKPYILPTESVCPGVPVQLQLANHVTCGDTLNLDWYALNPTGPEYLGTGDRITWEGSQTTTLMAIGEKDTLEAVVEIHYIPAEMNDTLLVIPNVFTPNRDGRNDQFAPIIRSEEVSDYQFQIHSRWGKEVFSSRDPATGWDGTRNREDLPSDIYVWQLSFTTSSCGVEVPIQRRGEISLIR